MIPAGWSVDAWVEDLDRRAAMCIVPEIAAELKDQADVLRPLAEAKQKRTADVLATIRKHAIHGGRQR